MYYPLYEPIAGESHTIGSEEETLEMVRSVLSKELRASRRAHRPKREGRTIKVFDAYYAAKEREARDILTQPATKAEAAFPELDGSVPDDIEEAPETDAPVQKRATRMTQASREQTRTSFKLGRRHFVWTGLVALAYFRPLWIVSVLLIFVLLVALLFWLAGPARVWAGILLALHRLAQKDPERSRRLRAALDRWAERWDRFLDLFPEGSVHQLYMPDFQALATAEDRHSQAMSARLARMAENG